MRKARVLIVDDAAVVRRIVTDVLSADPEIEVAGVAVNGRIALEKIPQLKPDVVTLDIEMPEMDGLQTLTALRKLYPKLPVIMFSTLTGRGATATLDALALGANDYVTKPANVGSVVAAMESVRAELIPKIKGFCPWFTNIVAKRTLPPPKPLLTQAKPTLSRRIEIVAIGVSTGGPNALTEVFANLPGDLPVPIVIVQHMPPIFTKYLAERLGNHSAVHVAEAQPGDHIHPGGAWIAPGDFHMALCRRGQDIVVQTHQGAPENSCRPAVDVLFRSVAELYGPSCLAVVLTGMGQDGMLGCQVIRHGGGRVIVQDEATSVVWGMPGAVVHAGLADEIVPLSAVAKTIVRETARGRALATTP